MNNRPNRPTHIVYTASENGGTSFEAIGAGWLHKDCRGLSIAVRELPDDFNGRLIIRARKVE